MVSSVASSDSRHLADLSAQPPQDPANLFRFPRAQERELGRLLADGGGLDVDRLVARAGAEDRALDLAALVLGHRQDIMMAHRRVVGKAEDPFDLGRAEHLPERLLNSLLHPADLAPQGREPAARGVEDRAAVIEATFDRGGDPREFSDALAKAPQARKLIAGEREPPVEIADGAKSLDGLGQRLRLENAARPDSAVRDAGCHADRRTGASSPAASASAISVVSACRPWISPGSRLGSMRRAAALAERAGCAGRDQSADLVKIEKLERVRVHVASTGLAAARAEPSELHLRAAGSSTRRSTHKFAEASLIIARRVPREPSRDRER